MPIEKRKIIITETSKDGSHIKFTVVKGKLKGVTYGLSVPAKCDLETMKLIIRRFIKNQLLELRRRVPTEVDKVLDQEIEVGE